MSGDRVSGSDQPDLFVRALARYVEALHRRYPGGPEQLRREALDARANMPDVTIGRRRGSAA